MISIQCALTRGCYICILHFHRLVRIISYLKFFLSYLGKVWRYLVFSGNKARLRSKHFPSHSLSLRIFAFPSTKQIRYITFCTAKSELLQIRYSLIVTYSFKGQHKSGTTIIHAYLRWRWIFVALAQLGLLANVHTYVCVCVCVCVCVYI